MPFSDKKCVFEDTYQVLIDKVRERGYCKIPDIAELVKAMMSMEMDAHIGVCGQNGVGKTMTGLMLLRETDPKGWKDCLMLADKTTDDLISYLLSKRHVPMYVDEMNLYFGYKKFNSEEQQHLVDMVELARSKEIPIIGCIRDPRKLTLNYRDGKLSVILWVLDRFSDNTGGYAAVLVAAANIEGEDRFGLMDLDMAIPDYEAVRAQLESLPSFIGWLKVPPVKTYFTKAEIDEYKKFKDTAMAKADLNYAVRKFRKKKMDDAEFEKKLEHLLPVLGEEAIEEARKSVKPKKSAQSRMDEFLGDD